MLNIITRNLVENIAFDDNYEFGENINAKVNNLLSLAIEEMSHVNPYVKIESCVFQPVNETFNGAYIPGCHYEYYIGFSSPQIELNSLTYSNWWSKFKNKFKEAWISSSRRLTKKREKRRKAGLVDEKNIETSFDKYTIEHLLEDLQDYCVKFLTNNSVIYRGDRTLRIVGKEEFGANTQIIVHPVISDGLKYKYFINRRKGFEVIDYASRAECNNAKFKKLGENYLYMLKIFNHFIREYTKQPTNQIFLESLMYNLPEDFIKGQDIYKNFIKAINYLRATDISDYKSVMDQNKTIFEEKNTANYGLNYSKFLKTFDKIKMVKE